MAVYFAVEKYLNLVSRNGRPSIDEASEMRFEVRNAAFLFPDRVLEYAEELFKKSNEYNYYENLSEPLRNRADLNEDEQNRLRECIDNQTTIQQWFFEQLEANSFKIVFSPFLKLPETLK